MSTTVSYKGATIATVSNDTKTLLTEGKYLEDDITLEDVSGGGAVLTTKNISANGTYNASSDSADGYSQVTVAVPASAVDTGTKNITANGNGQDVVGYAAVDVAVPNSYSAGDEGKVVSNGALVAQTSDTVTENDTYDTTLINSLTVNVSGGGGSYGNLAKHEEITFASTATNTNKVSVSLESLAYCVILVTIDEYPSAPDSNEYIAISWFSTFVNGTSNGVSSPILRPAGTIGNDNAMCSYNPSTGVLQIGGTYGHFMAGTTYHVYQFDIER